MDIKWLEKERSKADGYELRISKSKAKSANGMIAFTFKNNSHKKITNTEYMAFGLTSARLYFKEALTSTSAYKISQSGKSAYVNVPNIPEEFVGEYKELHYDATHDLFYVEVGA